MISLLLLFLNLANAGGVKDQSNSPSLSFVIESHDYHFHLSPIGDVNNQVVYSPNTQSLSGFQGSYKGITLAYLTSSPATEENITQFGKTSYEDLRGALFFGNHDQWVAMGYYNRYKGLYVFNSSQIDPSVSETDPRIQRPDLEVFNTGWTLAHVFSPQKYSAAAAMVQTSQQTSSGGSFLASLSFDAAYFRGTSPIVPAQAQSQYGIDSDLLGGKFATLSLSAGYGYTLVWNKLYLMALIMFGRGWQERAFTFTDETLNDSKAVSKFSNALALGYNGDRFFTSLSFIQDNIVYRTRSIELSPNLSSVRLGLGMRF